MTKTLLTLSSAAILLAVSSTTLAHDADGTIEAPDGSGNFTSGGNAIRTGIDGCLRSGTWSEDNQIGACEGVEEPAEEPEPEAEPEPTPEPEPTAKEPTITMATLGGEALFATNSAELNSAGEAALTDLVARLGSFQEVESMTVTGHTDSRGSESYNQALSERRAATVAAFLEAAYPGVAVTSQGAGESSLEVTAKSFSE